jgi:hypothetical protein
VSRPAAELVPAGYVGVHEDRHRVADRVREFLRGSRGPRSAYLPPRSDWLPHVWYANRGLESPSPEGYDPDEGPDGKTKSTHPCECRRTCTRRREAGVLMCSREATTPPSRDVTGSPDPPQARVGVSESYGIPTRAGPTPAPCDSAKGFFITGPENRQLVRVEPSHAITP